jgi:hypothetical protein
MRLSFALEPIISIPPSLAMDCYFLAAVCGKVRLEVHLSVAEFSASIATQLTVKK